MYHFQLAANIKYQLLNINLFPIYSYKLSKTINKYIRYIRLYLPQKIHVLKSTLLDLFDIKRLLVQKHKEYPNFDWFENAHDIIVASIISLIKVQYNLGFINIHQMDSYIQTSLKNSFGV